MALVVKTCLPMQGDVRDAGSIPGSGRSPRGGHGTQLQYSCLENPTDREPGGLQSTNSWAWLKQLSTHISGKIEKAPGRTLAQQQAGPSVWGPCGAVSQPCKAPGVCTEPLDLGQACAVPVVTSYWLYPLGVPGPPDWTQSPWYGWSPKLTSSVRDFILDFCI